MGLFANNPASRFHLNLADFGIGKGGDKNTNFQENLSNIISRH